MDPFPRLHPRPATGWVNDPNGLGFWDRRWHVMMQWNPDAPTWGTIHWAHLSSPDLVTWTEHGAALTPRPGTIDAGGCWSGVAAVDDAGRRVLLYSATPAGPAEVGVAIARQRADGTFEQPDQMTLPHPDEPRIKDVRDPFLFTYQEHRYALQGCRIDDHGAVLVWDASDLDRWESLGTLLAAHDVPEGLANHGDVWECPQLVRLGDTWVLAVSWMVLDGSARGTLAYAGDLTADPDSDDLHFTPRTATPLDHGRDFYAPQLLEIDGRVLCVGWVDEPAEQPRGERDWAGALTFPRELRVDDAGRVRAVPAPELESLKGAPIDARAPIGDAAWWARVEGPWELRLGAGGGASSRPVARGDRLAELWVDGSVIEAFDATGATVARAYTRQGERWTLTATRIVEARRLSAPATP